MWESSSFRTCSYFQLLWFGQYLSYVKHLDLKHFYYISWNKSCHYIYYMSLCILIDCNQGLCSVCGSLASNYLCWFFRFMEIKNLWWPSNSKAPWTTLTIQAEMNQITKTLQLKNSTAMKITIKLTEDKYVHMCFNCGSQLYADPVWFILNTRCSPMYRCCSTLSLSYKPYFIIIMKNILWIFID